MSLAAKKASSRSEIATLARKTDDSSLANDVKSFASQLGFATSVSNGYHDADFAPELAGTKLGNAGRAARPGRGRGRPQKARAEALNGIESDHSAGRLAKKPRARVPEGREHEKRASEGRRQWQEGAGPRPGAKAGKTLLGRDAPAAWHEALDGLRRAALDGAAAAAVEASRLEQLREEGAAALANEALAFEQNLGRNRTDSRWLQQVKQAGTTADKLAATTLMIRESAVGNLKSLDELLRWVKKRSGARAVAGQAVDALKELFVTALLPDRKLLAFEEQPLGQLRPGKAGRPALMLFYFEDAVRRRYHDFVELLREASRDNLDFIKGKAVRATYDLLRAKPEQEAALLSALVDKLGDPSRKTASDAGYLLGQLLEEHPAMSLVVAREAERFVFRPHLPARAVYYAVVFLNQMVLSRRSPECGNELAKKLVGTYFTLFRLILEGKIGHAADLSADRERRETARATKGGKKPHKAKRKQSAKLAARSGARPGGNGDTPTVRDGDGEVGARLLEALLAGVRRAFPFVDGGEAEGLAATHSDALFRATHAATFGVAVQALSLLHQLLDARSAVSDRYYRALYALMLAPDAARSNKSTMLLSLLFKSMKADVSERRVLAFSKRLLQVAMEQLPNFACGCLLLVSEVFKGRPALWAAITEAEDPSGGLEHFGDVDSEGDGGSPTKLSRAPASEAAGYDMSKREPLYCGAQRTCLWELLPFAGHAHPSAAAMARQLMAGVPIDYLGDPMRDFSVAAFLDKFMQKKPKVKNESGSLMRPRVAAAAEAATAAFEALASDSAAPDEAYFHKFFEVRAARERAGQRPPSRRGKRPATGEVGPLDGGGSSGSDSESDGMDDAIDGDEGFDDATAVEGDGAYDDLAAAMMGGASSDDGGGTGDGGSDTPAGDEERASGSSDAASDDRLAASEIPSEEDIFALAGASGSDGSGSEMPPDTSGSDSDLEGWVVASGAERLLRIAGTSKSPGSIGLASADDGATEGVESRSRRTGRKAKSRKEKGGDVFASASEYAEIIDGDRMPAVSQRPGHKRKRQKT